MNRLREKLNPEEEEFAIERPTIYRTGSNQYDLHCAECGTLYYVDEDTMRKAMSAREGDPAEITFSCDDCVEQYGEKAHAP